MKDAAVSVRRSRIGDQPRRLRLVRIDLQTHETRRAIAKRQLQNCRPRLFHRRGNRHPREPPRKRRLPRDAVLVRSRRSGCADRTRRASRGTSAPRTHRLRDRDRSRGNRRFAGTSPLAQNVSSLPSVTGAIGARPHQSRSETIAGAADPHRNGGRGSALSTMNQAESWSSVTGLARALRRSHSMRSRAYGHVRSMTTRSGPSVERKSRAESSSSSSASVSAS